MYGRSGSVISALSYFCLALFTQYLTATDVFLISSALYLVLTLLQKRISTEQPDKPLTA